MTPVTTGDRARRAVLPLLGAVQVALIAAITLLAVPLPAIQREFGLTQGGLAMLSSAYGLAFGGLLLLGGRLTDLRGPHRTLRTGLILFGVAGVAGALAPAYPVLLAARFAQGAGAALAAPAALALVTRVHPEGPERARALAVWGTLSVSGAVGGSLLSGLVASLGSWRWCLLIPVAVAAAGTLSRSLRRAGARAAGSPGTARPDAAAGGRERLDLPGALLGTGGLILLGHGLLTAPGPAPAAAGLALLAAFAAVELRTARPLLPPRMLVDRARRVALPVILLTAAASAATMFFLSLYFQQVRGLSAAQTSAAFLPNLLVVGMGPVAARVIGRFGPRAATVAGLLIAAAAMPPLALLAPDTPWPAIVLTALPLFAAGSGLALAGATVIGMSGTPPHRAGIAGGLINTAMEVGPTVGLAVLVAIASARTAALGCPGGVTGGCTGAVSPAAAVTGGYALAFGVAGAAFLLTAAFAAIATRTDTHRKEA
ncbi:MFS transporter [Thermobispora bispora]|uniref:Major facilitator superfamily MFS_1 n=1 Tax=Thermobispora bispora (strain ATCC 19993 / DSM 43833 / CBS 139.67 / JCM 10125 / KCTC 9307 / NBRC 14880 / R51) TaxID=469371 RepID=D6Y8N2_THEBD|nr:MFS transporter [Thermobispora bispora]ADG87929.1 major facilitator superfamily MFS_1 [Thermobispora bispora DSM 43833]